jgi:hypothetical protein
MSCQPGTGKGDTKVTIRESAPNPLSIVGSGIRTEAGKTTSSTVELTSPAVPEVSIPTNVESEQAINEAVIFLISSGGVTTWMEVNLNVVGATFSAGVPPHCTLAAIEL